MNKSIKPGIKKSRRDSNLRSATSPTPISTRLKRSTPSTGKAPLDDQGNPMTLLCPWCSSPMEIREHGWLVCPKCNATAHTHEAPFAKVVSPHHGQGIKITKKEMGIV